MKSADRRAAGFTLVEVLVALAVVGLALAAIAGVFSQGLMGHETASGAEAALAVAEEQLTLAGATLRPGASSGTFDGRFKWRVTVSPYAGDKATGDKTTADLPNSLPRLFQIAVSVAWQDGHHSRQIALSTLRLAAAPDALPGVSQ
jgi:general secretion pathway protein I